MAESSGLSYCTPCHSGRYSSHLASACISCTSGRFSTYMQSHCELCTPGTFESKMESEACEYCKPGSYSSISGASECLNCSIGKYSPIYGAIYCSSCEQGSFGTMDAAVSCEICPSGYFQNRLGLTNCSACPPGYSAPLPKSASCSICPIGTFSDSLNSTNCLPCENGTFQSNVGATKCDVCSPGRYAGVGPVSTCVDCPSGRFADLNQSSSCKSCPAGTYQSYPAQSHCNLCQIGKYSVGDSDVCSLCPDRQATAVEGSAQCIPCPSSSIASENRTDCLCTIGYFARASNIDPSGIICAKCPTGASCNVEGVKWESMETEVGYWRNGTESGNFYSCQLLNFCGGGRNSTCNGFRTGPICALCQSGYESFGTSCQQCGNRSANIATFAVMCVIILVIAISMYYVMLKLDKQKIRSMKKKMDMANFLGDDFIDDFYLYDDEQKYVEEEFVTGETPSKHPNFSYKLKILLGFFQISVGIASSIDIPWPYIFKQFVSLFNIANFDLLQWTRVGCLIKTNYYNKHLIVCLAPLILGISISSLYLIPKYIKAQYLSFQVGDSIGSVHQLSLKRKIRKFWKMFLFTLFLIYPSVSYIVLRLYSCETIDGVAYLVADFRIICYDTQWYNRALIPSLSCCIQLASLLCLHGFSSKTELVWMISRT